MYKACVSERLGINERLVNTATRVLYGELTCGKSRSLILSLSITLALSHTHTLLISKNLKQFQAKCTFNPTVSGKITERLCLNSLGAAMAILGRSTRQF